MNEWQLMLGVALLVALIVAPLIVHLGRRQ